MDAVDPVDLADGCGRSRLAWEGGSAPGKGSDGSGTGKRWAERIRGIDTRAPAVREKIHCARDTINLR